jgi:hypothetical protein
LAVAYLYVLLLFRHYCGSEAMANVALTTKALIPAIEKIFDDVYSNHARTIHKFEPYILEQCGKLYRVKTNNPALGLVNSEYKTGWLKLKEAQGILKLLKGNLENE